MVVTHMETGRLTGERAEMESARSMVTEAGAQFDLTDARELLRR